MFYLSFCTRANKQTSELVTVLLKYEELKIKPIKRKNRIVFDYSKDWLCGCGAGNFAYRKSCYKCNKQKLTEK